MVFAPLVVGLVLLAVPRMPDGVTLWAWVAVSAADLALIVALWIGWDTAARNPVTGMGYEVDVPWIPTVASGYHVGVDGLSLPLLAMTAVVFLACAVYSLRQRRATRVYACCCSCCCRQSRWACSPRWI